MKARTLVAAAGAAASLAIAAAPAPAATLAVSGGVMTYLAEPGEDNQMDAFPGSSAGSVYVADYSGSVAAPGAGCVPSPTPLLGVPPGVIIDYECTGVTTGVVAKGDDGFDGLFVFDMTVPVTIEGGADDDQLLAFASAPVTLLGGAGHDYMDSGASNDVLDGGDGNDRLASGNGSDKVTGGAGADVLIGDSPPQQEDEGFAARSHDSGPPGDDVLDGGDGDDHLYGGPGADTFSGGAGKDTASLEGAGADKLTGDIETLEGSEGDDTLSGTASSDELLGLSGDDKISGLDGDDRIEGNAGADTIDPGAGIDSVDSGAGDDTILARDGAADRIACGDGIDKVVADANDVLESACETVEKPGGVTTGGGPAGGTLTVKARTRKSGRKQTLTVSGKLAGATCQGLVRVVVSGLRPGAGSTTVKPDCTWSVKLVGTAKKRGRMKVAATLGTLAAKPVTVRAK